MNQAKHSRWTLEELKSGFEKFKEEYKRLPTSREIDKLSYLPTSRSIQRTFGGLEVVRKKLGYDIHHFGKGAYRSEIATTINAAGLKVEQYLEKFLVSMFGEPFVHTEKRIGTYKQRVDFFVYNASRNFAIDVFLPKDMFSMASEINIKWKKYHDIDTEIIFVVSGNYPQDLVNKIVRNRKNKLPKNITVQNIETLKMRMGNYKPYPNPTKKADDSIPALHQGNIFASVLQK